MRTKTVRVVLVPHKVMESEEGYGCPEGWRIVDSERTGSGEYRVTEAMDNCKKLTARIETLTEQLEEPKDDFSGLAELNEQAQARSEEAGND